MKLESKPSVLTVSGNPSAVSRVVDAKSNAHAPAFPVRHVVEGDVQAAVFTKVRGNTCSIIIIVPRSTRSF